MSQNKFNKQILVRRKLIAANKNWINLFMILFIRIILYLILYYLKNRELKWKSLCLLGCMLSLKNRLNRNALKHVKQQQKNDHLKTIFWLIKFFDHLHPCLLVFASCIFLLLLRMLILLPVVSTVWWFVHAATVIRLMQQFTAGRV